MATVMHTDTIKKDEIRIEKTASKKNRKTDIKL